jgi:hypothetical protein
VKSLSVTSRYLAQFGYLKLLRLLETRTQLELRKKGTGHGKSLRNRIVFKNIKQRTRRTDKIFPPRPLPLIQPSIRLAINNHTKLKMSNLQKLESDPEMEVVPHTPAKWNNWRTESSRGQLLRDILANGHPSLPNGKAFDEEKARKFVEQEFARRGCKRQAEPVIPASPESPIAASPLQPRASERSVAPNSTMEPSQFSHSGRNVSPQQRDPSTAIGPDSDEQLRKDTERENGIFEQHAVDHGYSPAKAKNIEEDHFGLNQIAYELDILLEQQRASEERDLKDTKPTAAEEFWIKLGYQGPPPGSDPGWRSVYLAQWIGKHGLHRGYGRRPTTSYSGMGNKHPSYQQSGPESRMGNQHSSGRTEDLAAERRNVQFDEIINQLADDLREQMRKKERAEGGRRDPDEGWERFKDALDEFRSR